VTGAGASNDNREEPASVTEAREAAKPRPWMNEGLTAPFRRGRFQMRLMSQFSSTDFRAPCLATLIMARPKSSVVVTYLGKSTLIKG